MTLNNSDKKYIELVEKTPIGELRHKLSIGEFGSPGSGNHTFISGLILSKELKLKDEREEETLSISRESLSTSKKALSTSRLATRIAISAIILSIIMAIREIIKLYSS